jgi:hypothetical protein
MRPKDREFLHGLLDERDTLAARVAELEAALLALTDSEPHPGVGRVWDEWAQRRNDAIDLADRLRRCECDAPRCERDGCQDKPTPVRGRPRPDYDPRIDYPERYSDGPY